jgi:hypothetical protein
MPAYFGSVPSTPYIDNSWLRSLASGDPWIDEGNVLVIAGKTKWKVRRDLIEHRSTFFASCLNDPTVLYDHCELIIIENKSSQEVETVLKWLHDNW